MGCLESTNNYAHHAASKLGQSLVDVSCSGAEIRGHDADAGPKEAATIHGIRTRAPNARVLVPNYPAIFPHSGGGCWPLLPVSDGDVRWPRAKQEELNAMVGNAAIANGATLIDVYSASRGHDACQLPPIRWVEPLVPRHRPRPCTRTCSGCSRWPTWSPRLPARAKHRGL